MPKGLRSKVCKTYGVKDDGVKDFAENVTKDMITSVGWLRS